MTTNINNSTIDAYKSVIDFNKTIITIASSVLTALIAYIVYQNIYLKPLNYISIFFIIASILFSLYGFGKAIQTLFGLGKVIQNLNDEDSRKKSILMTNIGGFFLIIGIVLLLSFNHKKEKSIDEILTKIESSTSTLQQKLVPNNLKSIEYNNEIYTIIFSTDCLDKTVKYSNKNDQILSVK